MKVNSSHNFPPYRSWNSNAGGAARLRFEHWDLFGIWVLFVGILPDGASVGKKRTCHQSNSHLQVVSPAHSKIGMRPMELRRFL